MTTVGQTRPGSLRGVMSDYMALTKPRVMSLLLVTALTGLVLASRGLPGVMLTLTVLAGGALASGGAGALNHWYEEDLDRRMGRTKSRPVATGRISSRNALIFGLVLNALSFTVLVLGANLLAASLAMMGTAVYFFVYTMWLKRTTPQNIVIGGAAGAIPPLVGWAAATGSLALPAWYLFAIIFFWTPPHFWALAIVIRDDYARAGVPMMPVIEGEARTRVQIVLYSILLAGLAVLFVVADPALGLVYGVGAAVLSAGLIYFAVRLLRDGTKARAWALYRFSLIYLALLFVLVMVDGSVI
ncbi:MAG: protoheme IX farnesyltransferase [Dehalococcoidia bacterium]|nr:protoheme IX farnesyltransferase [Dehalococcoidia bacterium]MSQ34791.1 protoheme IX farnesyltransferase [Dehalococcoidia bacterium]